MGYYPILLDLGGKKALVVGGGRVARRKVEGLLEFGASIGIVAKDLASELKTLVDSGTIRLLGQEFEDRNLDDVCLVIAATDDRKLNHQIAEAARKRGLLVNAVDQPSDCNFIVPSVLKRGELLIAISTSGKTPALAKKIREELDGQFGTEYETFLDLMGRLRKEILAMGLSQEENRGVFHEMIESGILEAISENDPAKVRSILSEILPHGIDIRKIINDIS
jgi:precorrin-2 dehydrogenase/sirohydrochlorin ferrochelatase